MRSFLVILVVPLISLSCATQQNAHYWYSANGLSVKRIEAILRENPVGYDENIRIVTLGNACATSHHIVQIRDAETLHVHKNHDLTAFIYRGHGTMTIGNQKFDAREGDILFVPRGIPHAFENKNSLPAAAIVVFTPEFDGKDTVPVSSAE